MSKPTTAEIFVSNLKRLMSDGGYKPNDIETISKEKGRKITSRHIRHILEGARTPSIEVADTIANVFNLKSWQLLMPTTLEKPEQFGRAAKLIVDWENADKEGKVYIEMTAKRESSRKMDGSNEDN